jgi:hypothetical protein
MNIAQYIHNAVDRTFTKHFKENTSQFNKHQRKHFTKHHTFNKHRRKHFTKQSPQSNLQHQHFNSIIFQIDFNLKQSPQSK